MGVRAMDDAACARLWRFIKGNCDLMHIDSLLEVRYERIGKGCFVDNKIGAVSRKPCTIIVNVDWYETTNEFDIRYILRHETRHLYQFNQIEKLHQGKPIEQSPEVILKWEREFNQYISNTPATEKAHFEQSCEFDAYVYASFAESVATLKDDGCQILLPGHKYIMGAVEQAVTAQLAKTPGPVLRLYRDIFAAQNI